MAKFATLVLSLATQTFAQNLSPVGQISYPSVAFTHLNGKDLHLTSFSPFGSDTVGEVPDIGEAMRANVSSIRPGVLTSKATWPNDVAVAPANAIAGYRDLLVISGGFLVPGKGNGAVQLFDRTTGNMNVITSVPNMFYHQVEWLDVDNDGLLDIITAGANKPIFGSGSGVLYWLKQPATNAMSTKWQQNKVISGPDVFFNLDDIDNDGKLDLLATQFFTNKLVLYRDLNWLNPSSGFKAQIIDDKIGPVFRAVIADLNGDGKKQIVVTNHIGDNKGGSVFVYETPSFQKHVVASGMVNILFGIGQAAPGAPVVVHPYSKSSQPVIVVGGDGAGKAYLLTPKDKKFNYDTTVFLDVGKVTIGQVSAGDVNGDGKAEVFVPAFESGIVHVFRFQ